MTKRTTKSVNNVNNAGTDLLTNKTALLKGALVDTFNATKKDEVSRLAILAVAMSDYLTVYVDVNGRLPDPKDFRGTVAKLESEGLSGKPDKFTQSGMYAKLVGTAIKAAYLVYRSEATSFRVLPVKNERGIIIAHDSDGAAPRGYERAVVYSIATVYPITKVKVQGGTTDVPMPTQHANGRPNIGHATFAAISTAYARFIEGRAVDVYGNVKREGSSGQGATAVPTIADVPDNAEGVTMLATKLDAMLRDGKLRENVAKSDKSSDALFSLFAIMATHMTAGGDFIPYPSDDAAAQNVMDAKASMVA